MALLNTGSAISLTTGNVTRQFGTFSMQIDLPAVSGFSSTTIKLATLPSIKQDFDLQESVEDISELRVNLAEITFEVFDTMGDKKSLFDLIKNLSITSAINIQNTVNSNTDYFIASKSTCEYDWKERKVTIEAKAALRYDVEITNYDNSGRKLTNAAGSSEWLLARDVIKGFLESQGSAPQVVIAGSFFDISYDDIASGGEAVALENPDQIALTYNSADTYLEAQDAALRLSVIEGSFLGVMLGYAFYVRRNYNTSEILFGVTTSQATISAGDLKSFGFTFYERSVRNYNTAFYVVDQNGNPTPTQTAEEVDANGSQDVSVDYRITVQSIEYGGGGSDTGLDDWDTKSPSVTYMDSVQSAIGVNARESYARALGINLSGDAGANQAYSVEFEILGITTLLPFQYIAFSTGIHPSLDSTKIRPTSLEYNLEDNVVSGEGYFI